MSAHRSLARLPLEIFECLQDVAGANSSAEDLRREIVAKLQQIGRREGCKTVGALLRLSPTALLRALDPLLTYHECQEFYRRTCLHCAPKPMSALELLHQTYDINLPRSSSHARHAQVMRYLPTGLPALDEHLRGGFRVGTVTEVVGCAATAKTQLSLQMAVVAAAVYSQGSILVDTEKKVSMSRLQEITAARVVHTGGHNHSNNTKLVLENISVHSPNNMEELQKVLDSLEEEILVRNDDDNSFSVRLLVIDSIAAPARREFGTGAAATQAATILQIAQTVKRLADQFQLAVLVINQVGGGASMANSKQQPQQANSTVPAPAPAVKAALGTAWHHCVSTRIQLQHHTSSTTTGHQQQQQQRVRQATVVKSNLVGPSAPLGFQVTIQGLVEL